MLTHQTGLQLCATIPSFKQLEDLNDKKKIEGLTIVISINSKGKFSASIDLPESFKVSSYTYNDQKACVY